VLRLLEDARPGGGPGLRTHAAHRRCGPLSTDVGRAAPCWTRARRLVAAAVLARAASLLPRAAGRLRRPRGPRARVDRPHRARAAPQASRTTVRDANVLPRRVVPPHR